MRTLLLGIITLISFQSISAQNPQLDSLYRVLDDAISQSPSYIAAHQQNIRRIQADLIKSKKLSQRYDLSYRLYEAYLSFRSDSALYYLDNCAAIAKQAGRTNDVALCKAKKAFLCSTIGLFNETLEILSSIPQENLNKSGMEVYYRAYSHVYTQLGYYTKLDDLRKEYLHKAAGYDSLLNEIITPQSEHYMQILEEMAINSNDHAQSMMVNNEWIEQIKEDSREYAIAAFYRYLEMMAAQDSIQMMQWLVRSAIADVRNAVMDQGSMWELANQLLKAGSIAHAYRYIDFASECAERFGTRLRSWQISPIVSNVSRVYQEENKRQSALMWMLIGVISLLAISVFGSLLFVSRQRNRLKNMNLRLQESMQQLSKSSAQQADLNTQLKELNSQLAESNHVKEEYVGRFMQQCSIYIDKMDEMRRRVSRMAKNHEYEQLAQLTRHAEFKEKELDEFYALFDTAFLQLFPDFVEKFNALLKPEERITLEEGAKLTTTLRVFALIRLGIEDSSKIAEFLHYSVNTIYNYRARVKNGAIRDREHFEDNVKAL
ncbi:MAG: transcriptional regulator [Prevotella sp.]|nr:transcriptional regulator [Prevotella sp.]